MHLTLTRSGGFLGSPLPPVTLDTALLPSKIQGRVEALVNESGFFELPAVIAVIAASDAQRDRFQFELKIKEAGGRTHTVTFDEQAASESLSKLAQAIKELARR